MKSATPGELSQNVHIDIAVTVRVEHADNGVEVGIARALALFWRRPEDAAEQVVEAAALRLRLCAALRGRFWRPPFASAEQASQNTAKTAAA